MSDALKDIAFGGVAGCCAKVIEFPFDTIKVRLQAAQGFQSRSTWLTIKYTYVHEGAINGFYKGIKAPMVGLFLENAVLFVSYNYAMDTLKRAVGPLDHVGIKAASGAFLGLMALFVLSPVELIKCNLQVANLTNAHQSYAGVIRGIVKKDGIVGMWRGLSSTLVRECGGTAVWFTTYEVSSAYLKRVNPDYADTNLLASGALAGVLFNFSMFPVDTIKSNMQTTQTKESILATGQRLVRQGGVRSLYHGLGITLVRAVPANALLFYVYEFLKKSF